MATDAVLQEEDVCRVELTLLTDDWYQSVEWYQWVDPDHCLLAAVVVHHQTDCFLTQEN